MSPKKNWISEIDEFMRQLEEQFRAAVAATEIKPEQIEACREVLVKGRIGKEVAKERGIDPGNLYRSCAIIDKKLDEICELRGLVRIPLVLPQRLVNLVKEIQAGELEDFLEDLAAGKIKIKRKRVPRAPVASKKSKA